MGWIILMPIYEDFLNELVILEKKYLLYSRGHDFVNQATWDLLRTVEEIHRAVPSIKIVDNGYNLVINDAEFKGSNLKAGYLSQLLGGRGILSVTIYQGVGFSSLMDFLYLLNSIPNNSKLLYHTDIQYAIHNIDSIEVEEIDYGGLSYGYGRVDQDGSAAEDIVRIELYQSLRTLDPNIENYDTDELVDIALEELSRMPQAQVPMFLQGLSDDAVAEIIARVNSKKNSISPSLLDLLAAMDSARNLGAVQRVGDSLEEISSDQLNKLVEREAYELYVSEDYRQHLRSLLSYDIKSQDGITDIDIFDRTLINRTIVTALVHLTNNGLDPAMKVSFVDSIHSYLDEFIDSQDWEFINTISSHDLVASYLKQEGTILGLSEAVKTSGSYTDRNLIEVIKTSGPKNLGWLLEAYFEEADSRKRRGILGLVQAFQETAAIRAIRRYLADPTLKISLLMPIVKDHLGSIPGDLSSKLFNCDSVDARLLAMRILLTQGDDNIRGEMEGLVRNGENDLVLGLLELVKEFRISELVHPIVDRISTFYINETSYRYIVKAIDTVSWVDSEAFREIENRLMKKRITLSPGNLRRIRSYLKGVSHDHISR
jgi:hypothetical protein